MLFADEINLFTKSETEGRRVRREEGSVRYVLKYTCRLLRNQCLGMEYGFTTTWVLAKL